MSGTSLLILLLKKTRYFFSILFFSSQLQNETSEETPIFRLLRQDFTTSREQGQIVKVAVANFLMVIATEFSHVIKWDMHSEDMQGKRFEIWRNCDEFLSFLS